MLYSGCTKTEMHIYVKCGLQKFHSGICEDFFSV